MPRSPTHIVLGSSLLLPLLASTMLYIFAWPAVNTKPHRLPVGFVTTPTLEARLPRLLEQIQEGGFEPRFYKSELEARAAIQRREIYGALLIDPATPSDFTLLTASAASPAVAQLLTGIGNSLGALLSAAGFSSPKVNDVVPATSSDPRQAGLATGVLPLILSGAITALLLVRGLGRLGQRIVGLGLVMLTTGASLAAIWQYAFGTLAGSYGLNALVAGLTVGAIAAFVAGLGATMGTPGFGLGLATLLWLSNPFSAINSAPQLLPEPWGAIGQGLPLGAFGTLIRSVAFFNGEGGGQAWTVLSLWLCFGLALLWVGSRRAAQGAKA
ncbi:MULTISPECIES: ABC transporter permease [unclassified Meiothermus]|uniref:ABC transporter permease n=1 Tax=unclassified Meiothermus TaxID=370471 RepID=UPI00101E962E|nr:MULTISPECIES: ABC transporter permease [unclassified Meiothermus]RYM28645.1 ABC transporter permease [Meiothermus sp. PNK-Is4]